MRTEYLESAENYLAYDVKTVIEVVSDARGWMNTTASKLEAGYLSLTNNDAPERVSRSMRAESSAIARTLRQNARILGTLLEEMESTRATLAKVIQETQRELDDSFRLGRNEEDDRKRHIMLAVKPLLGRLSATMRDATERVESAVASVARNNRECSVAVERTTLGRETNNNTQGRKTAETSAGERAFGEDMSRRSGWRVREEVWINALKSPTPELMKAAVAATGWTKGSIGGKTAMAAWSERHQRVEGASLSAETKLSDETKKQENVSFNGATDTQKGARNTGASISLGRAGDSAWWALSAPGGRNTREPRDEDGRTGTLES